MKNRGNGKDNVVDINDMMAKLATHPRFPLLHPAFKGGWYISIKNHWNVADLKAHHVCQFADLNVTAVKEQGMIFQDSVHDLRFGDHACSAGQPGIK